MSLLGTIYGGSWEAKGTRAVANEFEAELKQLSCKVNNILVVLSPVQRKNDDGSMTQLKNPDGSPAFSKSLQINLVSTVEKDAEGNPKSMGQMYQRLSRKSTLEPGDLVDPKSLEIITTERLGETREFWDGKKLES